jgi:XTP/dITP diphosphohydrolase
MKSRTVVICSHNAKKARELTALLPGWEVLTLADFPPFPQPEEDASTFADNAAIKAAESSKNIPHLCLADDSGLCVDALGGQPGVHSARFAGRHGDDAANNQKLLEMLDGVAREKRTAHFACVVAAALRGEILHTAEGRCDGWIAAAPVGEGGFGYDPLFIPDDQPDAAFFSDGKTFAQMSADIKNRISHRAHAMRKMVVWLQSHHSEMSLLEK